ncbi:hypothetical protein GGD50_000609 [Rhizobium paranaense]|uniref:Uncharacterized protein n=1 Tax=Rhizobium paranaense TaxID=1650438 RepID=A0A7W8XMA2_9HYPH|nr:hypothetical protein [Rhizobium paranaense]
MLAEKVVGEGCSKSRSEMSKRKKKIEMFRTRKRQGLQGLRY